MKLFTLTRLSDDVYMYMFGDAVSMALALLRIVETPYWRPGKRVDYDKFLIKYIRESGSFDYHKRMGGYNIPSECFEIFISTYPRQFRTEYENRIIDAYKRVRKSGKPGTFIMLRPSSSFKNCIQHELAHAIYCCDDKYAAKIRRIIREADQEELVDPIKHLTSIGTRSNMLGDELHAYLATDRVSLSDFKSAHKLRHAIRVALHSALRSDRWKPLKKYWK